MPGCRYVEEIGSAAMLAAKRLAGITPDVNLRENVTCMPLPNANKAAHSGFETQRRHHQKSIKGYQWLHVGTYVLQNLKKKKLAQRVKYQT